MPNCITLTRKGEKEPMNFGKVDDLVCEALGVQPDPVKFYRSWYDIIGLGIALGDTLPKMRAKFAADPETPELAKIAAFLDDNFTTDAWYQPKF